MADVLRATTIFPAFQAALSVHLLEVSPVMRALQRRTLSGAPAAQGEPPSVGTVHKEALGAEAEAPLVWTSPKQRAAGGVGVAWLSQLEDLPEDGTPLLLLAHEFLDALPVHQLSRVAAGPRGWRERMVELPEHVRAAQAEEAEAAAGAEEGAGSAEEGAGSAEGGAAVPTGDVGSVGAAGEAAARRRARQRESEAAEVRRAEEEAEAAGEACGARRQLELVLARSSTPAAQLYGAQLGEELHEAEAPR